MIDDGPNEIDLQLTPQLEKEGIVTRAVFYRKTSSVQVLLNHQYESKSIVTSISINDWNNTHDLFEKTLKRKGIKKQHIPLLADVLDENYHVIISQPDNASGARQQQDDRSTETAAQIALRLAGEQCSSLFLDQFGTPHAAIEVGDHVETLPLKSSRFRNWLCKTFYNNSEGKILTSDNVTNVLSVLKARAEFDRQDTRSLNLRVASRPEEPNTIFYDLTNKDWEYVKITSEGRRIVQSSKITPILFNRRASQQPQVYPVGDDMYDGDDIFHSFMKLVNVKGEDNKLLLKCYIISLFYPDIPKPVLMLHGEQGSAKSTLQELIRVLVDPSSVLTLTFPRDINELVQKLSHNYVAYFDNVSSIPDWISDQLCRAVTGSGFSKRELYTDDEDIIYNFKCCIGFNGINLGATKADLLDRGLIIELERIARQNQRRIEEIWAEFNALKPKLLAYIFDTLVKVLQVKAGGGITHELKELPRMADFAEIGEIISRCMVHTKYEFINAYYRNIELQTEEAIAANIVGNAIIQFMQDKAEWEGTATELHMELEEKAASLSINVKDKSWPKSAPTLSRKLNQIKTNLREIGIEVQKAYLGRGNKKSRVLKIRIISSPPSQPSPLSETQNHAQFASDTADDSNDGDDGDDTLHALHEEQEKGYRCYYCDHPPAASKDDYEHHVVTKHGKPAYPNKAEIEKRGLIAQGKDWET